MDNKFLFAIFGIGIFLRALVILQGGDFLISKNIIFDDSLIFAKGAMNIQAGKGYSFDGQTPNPGGPPLWPILLSFFPLSDNNVAVILSAISGTFFIASAFFMYRIFERFLGRSFSTIFTAIFLINPFFLLLSLNGMEYSLFIFSLSALFWFYFKFREEQPSTKSMIILAVISAFSFLIREEGIAAFAACMLDYVLIDRKKNFTPAAKCVGIFSAIYLSYIAWRFLTFGEVLSSNLFVLLNTHWLQKYGILQKVGVLVLHGHLLNFAVGSLALALLGILLKKELLSAVRPIWFYSIFNILFYSIVAPVGIFRYQFPSEVFLASGIAALFLFAKERFLELFKKSFFAGTIFIIIFLIYISYQSVTAFLIWTNIQYTGDGEIFWANKDYAFKAAAEFSNENLPEGSVVALNHIGTFSWFYHGRTVDSLGKIDYKVVQAAKDGRLKDLLEKKGATYIVDLFSIDEFNSIEKSDVLYSKEIYSMSGVNPFEYIRGNHGPLAWYVAVVNLNDNTVNLLQN